MNLLAVELDQLLGGDQRVLAPQARRLLRESMRSARTWSNCSMRRYDLLSFCVSRSATVSRLVKTILAFSTSAWTAAPKQERRWKTTLPSTVLTRTPADATETSLPDARSMPSCAATRKRPRRSWSSMSPSCTTRAAAPGARSRTART
ncbi:hypothetical protein BE20_32315 [Sorangium cellulosum]|nr:hypothetical protein BE20_32315 [Sorangium cellulosum]